jgi:hypothetical protein
MTFLIIDKQSPGSESRLHIRRILLEAAAELTELDPHEIEWAIEEYGRCDTDRFIIINEEFNSHG